MTGNQYCTKNQFANLVQRGAREHEGLLTGPTPSHVAVYRQWMNSNSPQDSMEAVVGFLPDFSPTYSFAAHVDGEFDQNVAGPASRDPKQGHHPPGIVSYPNVPCQPRLF